MDLPYFLSKYDPDPLHFYLTATAPVLTHTAQRLHEFLGYEGQLFGTQQVVEYQEEARRHQALTYNHSGAIFTLAKREQPPGGCCASRCRSSRSWTRACSRRSTHDW